MFIVIVLKVSGCERLSWRSGADYIVADVICTTGVYLIVTLAQRKASECLFLVPDAQSR